MTDSTHKIAEEILRNCRAGSIRIATAESCTGGMIAAALTAIAGSSDVFECGYVVYSNAAKTNMLGVPADLIKSHGAVSAEVACAMAQGAWLKSNVGLALAVTGVAGPGHSDSKPEGLVYLGLATSDIAPFAKRFDYGAIGRSNVRSRATNDALALILATLISPK